MSRIIFTTDRLLIRTFVIEDLAPLSSIFADPEVMRYMGRGLTATRSEVREMIIRRGLRGHALLKNVWAIICRGDSRLIGSCGILDCNLNGQAEVEIGYQLAQHAWGRGYATEVARGLLKLGFDSLDVTRLVATTHPDNLLSQRVLEKAGMIVEQKLLLPKGPRLIYVKSREEA